MQKESNNPQYVQVGTKELCGALKELLRFQRSATEVDLSFREAVLQIAMGHSSKDVPAEGDDHWAVTVPIAWAKALIDTPPSVGMSTLRLADGQLFLNDSFRVSCSVRALRENASGMPDGQARIRKAYLILQPYGCTEQDIESLIEHGHAASARLWGAGDGDILEYVAAAWRFFGRDGVEPSAIRTVFDRISSQLYKRSEATGVRVSYGPFKLDDGDVRELFSRGSRDRAALFQSLTEKIQDDVILSWKELAPFGIDAFSIARVIIDRGHLSAISTDLSEHHDY